MEKQIVLRTKRLLHMRNVKGVYAAAKADVAIIRGPGARTMRNAHGVVIPSKFCTRGREIGPGS